MTICHVSHLLRQGQKREEVRRGSISSHRENVQVRFCLTPLRTAFLSLSFFPPPSLSQTQTHTHQSPAMDLSDIRSGVALKKVHAPADGDASSTPALRAALLAEAAANRALRAVDIEAWCHGELAAHSFRTVLVPLSPADAEAIVALYWQKKPAGPSAAHPTAVYGTRMDCGWHARTDGEAPLPAPAPAALTDRLDAAMAPLARAGAGQDGIFAKLSSRSPKDSRMCQARALEGVCAALSQRVRGGVDPKAITRNDVTATIMGETVKSLKLRSGADVLECFATSDRVCEDDLPLALSFRKEGDEASWSQHICLREWTDLEPWQELRGFVVERELVALSQYFTGVVFPQLAAPAAKARALESVRRLHAQVKETLHAEDRRSYSLDIALVGDRAMIIELNPWGKSDGMGTGAALFDVTDAADRAVLFGDAPFEFRVATETPGGPCCKVGDETPGGPLLDEGELRDRLVGLGLDV